MPSTAASEASRDFAWKPERFDHHCRALVSFCEDDAKDEEAAWGRGLLHALYVRRSVAVTHAPPIEKVIAHGLLKPLIERCNTIVEELSHLSPELDETALPKVRRAKTAFLFEALWILTNVCSGDPHECKEARQAGVVPLCRDVLRKSKQRMLTILMALRSDKNIEVAERAGIILPQTGPRRARHRPLYLPCGTCDDDGYGGAPPEIWRAFGLHAPERSEAASGAGAGASVTAGRDVKADDEDEEMEIEEEEGDEKKAATPSSPAALFASVSALPVPAASPALTSDKSFATALLPDGLYFGESKKRDGLDDAQKSHWAEMDGILRRVDVPDADLVAFFDMRLSWYDRFMVSVADQAIFAVGNVAGDCAEARDLCCAEGIPAELGGFLCAVFDLFHEISAIAKATGKLVLLSEEIKDNLLPNSAWLASNLTRKAEGKPTEREVVQPLVIPMGTLLTCRISVVVHESLWFWNHYLNIAAAVAGVSSTTASHRLRDPLIPIFPLPQTLATGLLPSALQQAKRAALRAFAEKGKKAPKGLRDGSSPASVLDSDAEMRKQRAAFAAVAQVFPIIREDDEDNEDDNDDENEDERYAAALPRSLLSSPRLQEVATSSAVWFLDEAAGVRFSENTSTNHEVADPPLLFRSPDSGSALLSEPFTLAGTLTLIDLLVAQVNYYSSAHRSNESAPDYPCPLRSRKKKPAAAGLGALLRDGDPEEEEEHDEEEASKALSPAGLCSVADMLLSLFTFGDNEDSRILLCHGGIDALARAALSFGPRSSLTVSTAFSISNGFADTQASAARVMASPYVRRFLAVALCPRLVPFLCSERGSLVHPLWASEPFKERIAKELSYALHAALSRVAICKDSGPRLDRPAKDKKDKKGEEEEEEEEAAGGSGGAGVARVTAADRKAMEGATVALGLPLASPELVEEWLTSDFLSVDYNTPSTVYEPRWRPLFFTLAGIFRKEEVIPGAEGERKVAALAEDVLDRPWAYWICPPPPPPPTRKVEALVCHLLKSLERPERGKKGGEGKKKGAGDEHHSEAAACGAIARFFYLQSDGTEVPISAGDDFDGEPFRAKTDADTGLDIAYRRSFPFVDVDEMWGRAAVIPAQADDDDKGAKGAKGGKGTKYAEAAAEATAASAAASGSGKGAADVDEIASRLHTLSLGWLEGEGFSLGEEPSFLAAFAKEQGKKAKARDGDDDDDEEDGLLAEPLEETEEDGLVLLKGLLRPRSLCPLVSIGQLQQGKLASKDSRGNRRLGIWLVEAVDRDERLCSYAASPFPGLFFATCAGIVGGLVRRAKAVPLSEGLKRLASRGSALRQRPELLATARAGFVRLPLVMRLRGVDRREIESLRMERFAGPADLKPLLVNDPAVVGGGGGAKGYGYGEGEAYGEDEDSGEETEEVDE